MSESKYFATALTIAVLTIVVGIVALILHPSPLTFFLLIGLTFAAAPTGIMIANRLDHP